MLKIVLYPQVTRRSLSVALAIALVLGFASCKRNDGDDAIRDIHNVARSYTKALDEGDAQGVLASSVPCSDAEREVVQLEAKTVRASRDLYAAAKARFGEHDAKPFQPASADLSAIDRSPVKVEGDTATLTSDEAPLKLRRVGGVWKVDDPVGPLDYQLVQLARIDATVAAAIRADRYPDVNAGIMAVKDSMDAFEHPSPESPRGVALSYIKALTRGDAKAALRLCNGAAPQKQIVEAFADVFASASRSNGARRHVVGSAN